MAHLPRICWGDAEATVQRVFESLYDQRGNVPNLFRVLAHRPQLMRTFTHHFNAVLTTGEVDTRLKELLAVRVSTINDCEY
jgi:alkylhydroperoxidase family enzyme